MKTATFVKIIVGLLLMIGFVPLEVQAFQGMPPAQVAITKAQKQTLAPLIQVPGTLISKNDSRISSEVNGRVVWIAEVGDSFDAGEVIARLDDRFYQASFKQAEANVKRLEADLKLKIQALERFEELATTSSAPVSRLEEATASRDMTQQDLIMARAVLDNARDDLGRTQVKAPFPGSVVERGAQMGELTGPGTILLRLVDTSHVEIRVQAPLSIAPYISNGLEVTVSDENKSLSSPIRTVVPVGDDSSRMMEVRILIEAGEWIIGSAVKVDLPSDKPREVVSIPRDALVLRANSLAVFKVSAENKAQKIEVKTGVAKGNFVEVIGDIQDGDQIVIRGAERLMHDQDVIIQNET